MTATMIPALHFESAAFPAERQFAEWARMLMAHDATAPSPQAGFPVVSDGFQVGPIMISHGHIPPVRLVRNSRRLKADGVDNYFILMLLGGRWSGDMGTGPVEMAAGEVVVMDMTGPIDAVAEASESIIVILPRQMLDEAVAPFAMHGLMLTDTALGRIFADFLAALVRRLPETPAAEAETLGLMLRDTLAAALNATRQSLRMPADLPLLGKAKRHIEANLANPFDAAAMAKALGTSRATLYRLFALAGGLGVYIARRRLNRAHQLLNRPDEQRTVGEIAFATGFNSPSHFSRAFRVEYGYTAGALRRKRHLAAPAGPEPAIEVSDAYIGWHGKVS